MGGTSSGQPYERRKPCLRSSYEIARAKRFEDLFTRLQRLLRSRLRNRAATLLSSNTFPSSSEPLVEVFSLIIWASRPIAPFQSAQLDLQRLFTLRTLKIIFSFMAEILRYH